MHNEFRQIHFSGIEKSGKGEVGKQIGDIPRDANITRRIDRKFDVWRREALRGGKGAMQFMKAVVDKPVASLQIDTPVVGQGYIAMHRITSYNVCYTKLLR